VQLQRTGGGGDIGPVALPALGFLLPLGVVAGIVGGPPFPCCLLPRGFPPPVAPRHQRERRQEDRRDAGERRGDTRVAATPADPFLDAAHGPRLDRPAVQVALQVLDQRGGRGIPPVGLLLQALQA